MHLIQIDGAQNYLMYVYVYGIPNSGPKIKEYACILSCQQCGTKRDKLNISCGFLRKSALPHAVN